MSTEKIVGWATSRPLLAKRLWETAVERVPRSGASDDLMCMTVDLLDPDRSDVLREILSATGASIAEADTLWWELGGHAGWADDVRWPEVRQALLLLKVEEHF
ncbi:hypothetical protein [Streptomyces sp. NPDC003077]|uniref:hypothetical protein n=1 Tax=Streptomyces sp. NPDC003077 TaxID=3154443 RepID=UPI0033B060AC